MNARTPRLAAIAAGLALVAGPARAADPRPDALEQEALQQETPAADRGTFDISGRLRASRDALSLELGGALLELRVSGDPLTGGEPLGGADPRARDFRATFSVDGKTTNLLLRFVPPPESGAPAETK